MTRPDEGDGGANAPAFLVLARAYLSGAPSAERVELTAGSLTIGRAASCGVALTSETVSRLHARLEQREGVWWVVDAGSMGGTTVNGERIDERSLASGDRIQIGGSDLRFFSGEGAELRAAAELARMRERDPLTRARNRQTFRAALEKQASRSRHERRELSLLVVAIDRFKSLNDKHGLLAGDHVLAEISSLLESSLRPDELIGRHGGGSFAVLLPETHRDAAARLAESLRARVAAHRFDHDGEPVRVTVSVGVAVLGAGEEVDDLLRRAEEREGQAKREGRDRVCS